MRIRHLLLTVLLALAVSPPAQATDPGAGSVSRERAEVDWIGTAPAGGMTDANDQGCAQPFCDSFALQIYDPGVLTITVTATDAEGPTDLLVVGPDGTQRARGSAGRRATTLSLPDAPAGRYEVRTGTAPELGESPGAFTGRAQLQARDGDGPPSPPAPAEQDVVVAIVDSGIAQDHQEFAPGQVVAWWDFVTTLDVPEAGPDSFDERRAPFDGHGHGTHTAAMAGGLGADPRKTPAGAPGVKLAIAKAVDDDGFVGPPETLAAALRWAVDHAKADVVSMSVNSFVPIPGGPLTGRDTPSPVREALVFQAITYARSKGALVTLSNGNGVGGAGFGPTSGASSLYSSSTDALTVGASGLVDGARVSSQPEVVSALTVQGPDNDTRNGYEENAGTSFAAPFVAGFASRLVAAAQAAGRTLTPAALERLVKFAARDTEVPPALEGYGIVDLAQLDAALAHARAGTLPARPSPDVSALYVEEVAGRERELNNGQVRPPG